MFFFFDFDHAVLALLTFVLLFPLCRLTIHRAYAIQAMTNRFVVGTLRLWPSACSVSCMEMTLALTVRSSREDLRLPPYQFLCRSQRPVTSKVPLVSYSTKMLINSITSMRYDTRHRRNLNKRGISANLCLQQRYVCRIKWHATWHVIHQMFRRTRAFETVDSCQYVIGCHRYSRSVRGPNGLKPISRCFPASAQFRTPETQFWRWALNEDSISASGCTLA